MRNTVATYRAAGLEAKWGKRESGAPVIFLRNPASKLPHQKTQWWAVDKALFDRAQIVGPLQAFDEATLLGNLFSLPA